jgi:tRNA-dihydrouridine synthase
MSNLLDNLPKGFLVLAPMDDVTDTVFRQIVADCAKPDLFFTEFVNVEALQSAGRETALRRLIFTDKDQPLIAQIWGKNPDNFYKTAQDLVQMGFNGVDLNFGCPDKKVVKNNTGGGTINVPDQAVKIINATREGLGGKLPLSVKTRIGLREYDESWIKLLLEQNLDMLTIHFRTVKEMSKYPAKWEQFAERIKELRDEISPQTLLVGNGDVDSYSEAKEKAEKYAYDGVMIARGVFSDPYVFSPSSVWEEMQATDRIELYKKHLRLYQETYPNMERKFDPIKKFCKIYINNFPGASDLRVKLMDCRSVEESLKVLEKY